MAKIINLANEKYDNSLWSIRQMLQEAIEEIDRGELDYDSAVLILKHQRGGGYYQNFRAVQCSCSEQLAMVDVHKKKILEIMFEEAE